MDDPVFEYNMKVFDAIFGKPVVKSNDTPPKEASTLTDRRPDLPVSPFAGMNHSRATGRGV